MGESGARSSKESRSNGHDKREGRRDLDTTSNKMESLHRLSEAELCHKKGSLPTPVHRPNCGPTGRIELLMLPQQIFGLQLDCNSSRRSREDDFHMSLCHIRLKTHAIQTM